MTLYETAIERFGEWLETAREAEGVIEPTAMTLATARADGQPGVRTVLLKHFDGDGFVFYTNTLSKKGTQLAENPQVALNFFWAPLARQVIVEGHVEFVSDAEADAYFASRPRLSQLGAWASHQSQVLTDRDEFEARLAEVEARFADAPVTRPPHWTGYRVRPAMLEFWQGRDGRLHDRERYTRGDDGEWTWTLLNP
ncbi:pyridoxamine 5'-phosphate oxidase [Spiribacter sp. SSL99]|uniref:pyridoxamine 5'-phosphate oxidase n=1 Tax=Spiribacter sp. SSL99 TaxID=1866884 RepID=UPI0013309E66|nr:pyridoxamine 5'-phosphate oxidase [Spiribacter sp. SSL99]KAF0286146.1 pyridoxamine 5'-phosphate oxidase [Spiribacter sp. SSL99]